MVEQENGRKRTATKISDNSGSINNTDVSRKEGIRKILSHQLDLEILHKLREAKVIEEEIERGQAIRELLEKLIINGAGANEVDRVLASGSPGPNTAHITEAYTGTSPGKRSARAISFTRDRPQSEPQAQYEVKPDGTVVKMRCPKCGADKFRSMLGFLNHCRIHCRLVFSSQDDRQQRCGVPIDPAQVPADYFTKHPTQLKQEMDLALIRAEVHGPVSDTMKKPMIKVEGLEDHSLLPGSVGDAEIIKDIPRESRYYIKRRIIIGNSAKSLAYSKKEQDSEGGKGDNLPTHKWRIYIKSPKNICDSTCDLKSFIKGVRFFLHPSYKSEDVVDVVMSEGGILELIRTGWGEFPVRIQLHFWDSRNKPIEIVHYLRFLTATTGRYVITAEQAYDIEIDRKTEFKIFPNADESTINLPPLPSNALRISNTNLLAMVIDDFPLAGRKGRRAVEVNYQPVKSIEDFLRLKLVGQKNQEMKRAKALCDYLISSFPIFSMSIGDVIRWCREKGYTPASVATMVSALEQVDSVGTRLLYCRFCGLAHLPQDKFEILQKNCSLRPRKIHLSSRTASSELIGRFSLLPESTELIKRLKQEYFNSAYIPHYNEQPSNFRVEGSMDDSEATKLRNWTSQRIQELCPSNSRSFSNPNIVDYIIASMRVFLKDLIKYSIGEIPESKDRTSDKPVLLTPLHIYRVITSRPLFDFLGNAYMLGGNTSIAKESRHE